MTKCTEAAAGVQLTFNFGTSRPIVGSFSGGQISSDGGLVLVKLADQRLKLTEQMSYCLADRRDAAYVRHSMQDLLQQRIYGIAAGYEDCNDAGELRKDPMHQICLGKEPTARGVLSSQPTLSRFENSVTAIENGFLQSLLVHSYIQRFSSPPKHLVLDVDTTCDPVHGYQQLSFFNGFYHKECFIPLFIFDQHGYPLLARLRPGNFAPAEDAGAEVRAVVRLLREAWPKTRIELRADAAFCNRGFYALCEDYGVIYYIGLKSNHALRCRTRELVARCKREYEAIYGPANQVRGTNWRRREERLRFSSKSEGRMQERSEREKLIRRVAEIKYQARSWDAERRVICRCDYTDEGEELRFIVTNSSSGRPKWVYENKYCRRGQCENWIKELKSISCDRLSCQEFEANQFRLLLHAYAYILLLELRARLSGTNRRWSVENLRLRLLKIGVVVRNTARRIALAWTGSYPWQLEFAALSNGLRC